MRVRLPVSRVASHGIWALAASAPAFFLSLGLLITSQRADARPEGRIDHPAVLGPRLTEPRREAPIDRDVTPHLCAICRRADETSGRIPLEAIRLDSHLLPDGIAVRATAEDPSARELLWKAALARGEMVESLRMGTATPLCSSCRARAELLRELNISAKRIPDGVELVYTSASPGLVKRIHAALRSVHSFPTSF